MHSFVFDNNYFESLVKDVNNHIVSLNDVELDIAYKEIFRCIDHTTLHDEDNDKNVSDFCHKATGFCKNPVFGSMASVCVFPEYVQIAKQIVSPYGLKVAAVVGGFPTGQMPLSLKLQEVHYAIENGADELDFVINRGFFIGGDRNYLAKEISSVYSECKGKVLLKVIIESGELKTPDLIYDASIIAMECGADFIKTSTGKSSIGATPEAAFSMLHAIVDFQKNSNRRIGFKVSGGISTISDALLYYTMTKKIMNVLDINNQFFRIGTSRLIGELLKKLTF